MVYFTFASFICKRRVQCEEKNSKSEEQEEEREREQGERERIEIAQVAI